MKMTEEKKKEKKKKAGHTLQLFDPNKPSHPDTSRPSVARQQVCVSLCV